MDRIAQTFARCKTEGRPAFVSYVCAGDPDAATSKQILLALAQPVPKGSAEAQGSLTLKTKYAPRPSALERVGAGTAMKKQIPLAAGQPVEGPRSRVRMSVRSKRKPAASAEAPVSEGRSSSSTGPNLLAPGREKKVDFIKAQILAYEPKTTKEEREAKKLAAARKEEQRQQDIAARKAARSAKTAENAAARKAKAAEEAQFNRGLREASKRLKQQGLL